MTELPSGWLGVPVSDIAEVNPPQPTIPIPEDDQVSFVRMASVEAENGILDARQLRPWNEVKKGYTKFQEGDVLFAKITPCMENGKFAIAKELHGQVGAGSTEFHVLRTNGLVREKYLLHFLLQRRVRQGARMQMQGAAGQLRVPNAFFDRLSLPLAPPEEQDRIVAEIEKQFTRLDAATAALKRVQANLKRYHASVLKAACGGRLVPTEAELARKEGRDYERADKLLQRILRERRARWETDALAKMQASGKPPKDDHWKRKYKEPAAPDTSNHPILPEGWVCVSLDTLADVIDPNPSHRTPKYVEHGAAFVSAENFVGDSGVNFKIGRQVGPEVLKEQIDRFPILPGAFAMSRYGTIGKTCKLPIERTYCLSYSLVVIQSSSSLVDSDFLRLVCSSGMIMALAKSRIQGAAIPDLGVAHIRSLPIAIPTREEQSRIIEEAARKLSVVDQMAENVSQQLIHGARLRQSILSAAFTGQLVPQDPTDEPASVLLERIRAERVESSKKPVARIPAGKRGQR